MLQQARVKRLVSELTKAKYFSYNSFQDFKLGSKPSCAWKSIFKTKQLLQEGTVWRIDNKGNVSIWKDKWVPKPLTFVVHSPQDTLASTAMVEDD